MIDVTVTQEALVRSRGATFTLQVQHVKFRASAMAFHVDYDHVLRVRGRSKQPASKGYVARSDGNKTCVYQSTSYLNSSVAHARFVCSGVPRRRPLAKDPALARRAIPNMQLATAGYPPCCSSPTNCHSLLSFSFKSLFIRFTTTLLLLYVHVPDVRPSHKWDHMPARDSHRLSPRAW